MDANGLRFWMLSDEADWVPGPGADYDQSNGRLRLRSVRDRPLPADMNGEGAESEARVALTKVPRARDGYGGLAYWDDDRTAIVADSGLEGRVRVLDTGAADPPDDLAMGPDGIVYVATGGEVLLHDVRGRWADRRVSHPGFDAWRLAPDPAGGTWVLDRSGRALGHVHGMPLPGRPHAPFTPCTARPCEENPDPARLEVLSGASWDGEAVALAAGAHGRLALLVWKPDAPARIVLQDDATGQLSRHVVLRGVRSPHAIAWASARAVAVRCSRTPTEALVYDLEDVMTGDEESEVVRQAATDGFDPVGEVYPMRNPLGGGFVHTVAGPPHYPTIEGSAPLLPLSGRAFPRRAEATGVALDSGDRQTVWHRLYLEALLPAQSRVRVLLAATNEPQAPGADGEWFEHLLGEARSGAANGTDGLPVPVFGDPVAPRASWTRFPSEIPYHPGVLGCEPVPAQRGLFTVLIQRSGRRVRTLAGRYLWVRVQLEGNGRSTPEIAAVRAYGSRFSYVSNYLPALYHETTYGSERDDPVAPRECTPADFLERFTLNPEGLLTLLEDRIGSAHLLTCPDTVPEASLEWLGSWIGLTYDPAFPGDQRRELLKAAPVLFKRRGTITALEGALGLATGGRWVDGAVQGGAVSEGRIVVVENFRLRRTFATILGADLADENDPLLAGLAVSGNSVVGDTLILGEEHRKEFLALFGADLPTSAAETAAIRTFFDRLAHRVTILVHDDVDDEALRVIRRVVDLEKPAHVESTVERARYPFLVAVASLIGIDTFLRPPPPARPVQTDVSALGDDFLLGAPSFDGRLGSRPVQLLGRAPAAGEPPTAVLRGPASVPPATPFALDGSESHAAEGHVLTRFSWMRLQ